MRVLGRWAYFFLPKSKCLVVVLLWADVVVAEAAVRASVRRCVVECMGLGVH